MLRAWVADNVLEDAFWFSSYYEDYPDPNLLDADGNLTDIGEIWMRESHTVYLPGVHG
jgi:hypothetical protein